MGWLRRWAAGSWTPVHWWSALTSSSSWSSRLASAQERPLGQERASALAQELPPGQEQAPEPARAQGQELLREQAPERELLLEQGQERAPALAQELPPGQEQGQEPAPERELLLEQGQELGSAQEPLPELEQA